MGKRKRISYPYQVRQIAQRAGVSLAEALTEYNRIQQARATSLDQDVQQFALGVQNSINQFKLKQQ